MTIGVEVFVEGLGLIIALLVLLALYFIPTIVANSRGKRNTGAIFAMNLLLGWTFLGWVLSLIWALTRDAERV